MKNLFKVNPITLEVHPVSTTGKLVLVATITTLLVGSALFYSGFKVGRNALIGLTSEEKLIIIQEHNKFSEERLIDKLKELNVKFPWIALAQAKLETGNFTSKVFRENSNLFGMREAKQRISTAIGTENNHAYYYSWTESVLDYSFYQCRYLSGIQTEEQYFQYLGQSYAENPNYVSILKGMVEKEQLKDKFK